jgi:hypothetical protein
MHRNDWSKARLIRLQKAGKIRGWKETKPKKHAQRKELESLQPGGRQKKWITDELQAWCNNRGLQLVTEYKFAKPRQFRFDWAIPGKMIAFEYEGLMSRKSRHTTVAGYTRDTTKYNIAQARGWKVYRYTAKTYKNLNADLNNESQ